MIRQAYAQSASPGELGLERIPAGPSRVPTSHATPQKSEGGCRCHRLDQILARQLGVARERHRRRCLRRLDDGALDRSGELTGGDVVQHHLCGGTCLHLQLVLIHIEITIWPGTADVRLQLGLQVCGGGRNLFVQGGGAAGTGLLLLHHKIKAARYSLHQREGLIVHLVLGELLGRHPLQTAVVCPGAETGPDFGAAALPQPVRQHDARVGAIGVRCEGGPEIVQIQRLQLLATKGLGHHLPLHPTARLGIPLALPDGAVVGQEGIGGAVGVVDELDVAGVRHGGRPVLEASKSSFHNGGSSPPATTYRCRGWLASVPRLEQPQGDRPAHHLGAIGGLQLLKEIAHVVAHRGSGDLRLLGDLLIGEPPRQPLQHLPLAAA